MVSIPNAEECTSNSQREHSRRLRLHIWISKRDESLPKSQGWPLTARFPNNVANPHFLGQFSKCASFSTGFPLYWISCWIVFRNNKFFYLQGQQTVPGKTYDRWCGKRNPEYVVTNGNKIILFLRSDSYPYTMKPKNFILIAEKTRGDQKRFQFLKLTRI